MNDSTSHNWSTISIKDFDFQVPTDFISNGLKFNESFKSKDDGQLATGASIIDEAEFVAEIRKDLEERAAYIPSPLYEFYDNCRDFMAKEYMTLLSGYISNVECIKTLKEFHESDRTMKYFKLALSNEPNFGKAQCLRDAANEYDKEVKSILDKTSKDIQLKAMNARQKAVEGIETQLKNCMDQFLDYGAAEWVRQCSSIGSTVNTLDQQYLVRPHQQELNNRDDDEMPNECELEEMDVYDKCDPMSTFLFALAVHDSKPMVNAEIQKRRTTAEQARRQAEALKKRQSAVNITASAAKPAEALDVFKNRFDDLDKLKARVCTVEKAMPKLKATVQKSASDSESKSEFPELAKTLMASMSAFKRTLDAVNAESPRKNDSGADIDKTTVSKQAQKRLRLGAMATETTANANHTTKTTSTQISKAQKPITLNTAAKPPNTDPPASTDESDQETEKWRKQKQRNVHHTNATGAPRSGHVGKPTTRDGKTVAKRGGFERGRGRGFARGHGPPRV